MNSWRWGDPTVRLGDTHYRLNGAIVADADRPVAAVQFDAPVARSIEFNTPKARRMKFSQPKVHS